MWRAENNKSARVEEMDCFGWRVHRHVLPVGSCMVVVATHQIDRSEAPNKALYVRGRGVVTNSLGGQFDDRTPGLFTGARPDHPAGTTRILAAEELEFWCFNWHANRGALPDAEPLIAMNAEPVELAAGQRVLLCAGSLGPHSVGPFVATGEPLVAAGDVYGFLIGADRG